MSERFYVYRIYDDVGETLYIGKGSGGRLTAQKKRFSANGEVLSWYRREKDAYAAEIRTIAEIKPRLNQHRGGNGSRAQKIVYRRSAEELEMERIGTRVYAARVLMRKGREALSRYLSTAQIDAICNVATSV